MKVRIDNITEYKKIIAAICNVPTIRKQLNSVEQCIELRTNLEEQLLELKTVDLTNHAITLKMPVEVVEEGRQIVLANKLKAMSSRLNNKLGLEITNENNLLNYHMRPYGSIVDNQYFSQNCLISNRLFDDDKYEEVCSDLGYFLDLIPMICSNTYNEREVYLKSNPNNIEIYVQFTETSYIRYKTITNTLSTGNFRAALRPSLLKIVNLLGDEVVLKYSKDQSAVKFTSPVGEVAIIVDTNINKVAEKLNSIINTENTGSIEITYEDISESIKWQSYGTNDTSIVKFSYDNGEKQFKINIQKSGNKNEPSSLEVIQEGEFSDTYISVSHITKALKAIGSPKNKIIPIEYISLKIKAIDVKNSAPIKAIHLSPSQIDDITSDVILYEAIC